MLDRLLINRDHARIWGAGLVSLLGDQVFDLTVLLWITAILARGEPWAPAAGGGVLIAVLLPMIVASPLAGVWVDRWDPRRTMLVCDAIRAALVAVLVVVSVLPEAAMSNVARIISAYVIVAASSTVSRFFLPARFSIVAYIVPESSQAKAAGFGQASIGFAAIVGPPLASPLLFTAGVHWAFVINAASYLVSYAFLIGVRRPQRDAPRNRTDGEGFRRAFVAGLRVVRRSRVLLTVVMVGVTANFAANILNTIDVFFVPANLQVDVSYVGYLHGAMGLGAIAGALIAGAVGHRVGLSRTLAWGLFGAGVGICVYARTTAFLPALIILLVSAFMIAMPNTVLGPIIIRETPRETLGRVISLLQSAVQLMSIVSILLTGWLASTVLYGIDTTVAGIRFGTYDLLMLIAGSLMLVAGVAAVMALRSTDRDRTVAKSLGVAAERDQVTS